MQCACAICELPRSKTLFFTLSHKRHDFRKKKKALPNTIFFSRQILSATFLCRRRNEGDTKIKFSGLHVKHQLLLPDFKETWLFSTVFQKYSNIKFHRNPSGGSRVVPCGQKDRLTDMTQLIVAFRNFAKAPTNWLCLRKSFT